MYAVRACVVIAAVIFMLGAALFVVVAGALLLEEGARWMATAFPRILVRFVRGVDSRVRSHVTASVAKASQSLAELVELITQVWPSETPQLAAKIQVASRLASRTHKAARA